MPFTTHWLSRYTAASSTQCAPPVLMARLHVKLILIGTVIVIVRGGCCIASQVLHRAFAVAGVARADGEAVVVVVRGARDLPEPELVGVGLTVGEIAVDHVRLGLEDEDGNVEIGADHRRRRGGDRDLRRLRESAPVANRLCTRKPSYTCTSGCTASI